MADKVVFLTDLDATRGLAADTQAFVKVDGTSIGFDATGRLKLVGTTTTTTNLSATVVADVLTVFSDTGTDALLPLAAPASAGVMSSADKTKLNTYPAVYVAPAPTNLALGTATPTAQPVTSSTGTGITLPSATPTTAGLLSSGDKVKLDLLASPLINAQLGTAYTTVASDAGKTVTLTNASAITVTLSALPSPSPPVTFVQMGAGQVTFVSGTLTVRHVASLVKTAGQYGVVLCNVVGTNAILSGDMA